MYWVKRIKTSPQSPNFRARLDAFHLMQDDVAGFRASASPETACSNGIAGVEASGMCCTLGCGTCGGPGCGSRGAADGLTAEDCCAWRIRDSGVFCDVSGTAPCIIDSCELLLEKMSTISISNILMCEGMPTSWRLGGTDLIVFQV